MKKIAKKLPRATVATVKRSANDGTESTAQASAAASARRPAKQSRKRSVKPTPPPPAIRLAKALAQAGLCSRRQGEVMIRQGRVCVDGVLITDPAINIEHDSKVTVDGRPVRRTRQPTRLWRYYKPVGLMVTSHDPQGRPTVFDALAKTLNERIMSVGRLDLNSQGLLLLTNDGALAGQLMSPALGWKRVYRVRVRGQPGEADLARLAKGIVVDGERFGALQARVERQGNSNAWLEVVLHEGRNREIRRAFAQLGFSVNKLIRTEFGPFKLGELPVGKVEAVAESKLRSLFDRKRSVRRSR